MANLPLSSDAPLTTTRAVCKRLDYDRAVPREVIEECLENALQAPNGGNMNRWRWIVVDDRETREGLAALYNQGLDDFIATFGDAGYAGAGVPGADRIEASMTHLRENFHHLPAVLVPMIAGRTEGPLGNVFYQASTWGSIGQAGWSFMLALHARGLGSAWTPGHLWRERETAERLRIPHEIYMQVGRFPVAYTRGTDFQPGHRTPLAEVVSWNRF